MQTTPKANNILGHFFALLGAVVMLAIATWVSASSSEQVKPLDNLAVPRTGHTATALSDGSILITGGRDSDGNLVAASEIFDPETQTSSASATLHTARVDHSATVLADGRVLVAGGTGASGALSSAEMFDPAHPENGFQTVGSSMSTARTRHTATLLNDGHVLIAGGDAQGSAEFFDPATGTFMPTIWPLTVARSGHTATLFTDDSVLLAGGNSATMETYVSNQGFTLDVATMSVVRTGHWAFELSDTRLLLFQGDTGNTIDEFNPTTGTITPKGSLDFHASSSSLLANGKVLVLGTDVSGLYNPDAVPPAPDFTAFDETGVPHSGILPRTGQSSTQLPGDKKILIAGGVNTQNIFQGMALFNPARIWTDRDDYYPGDPVVLSGSGWKANENVYLYAVDNINQGWSYGATETAGADGSFVDSPYFIVQQQQLGANFTVTAVGAQSTMQADVEFTDSPRIGAVTTGPQTGTLTYGTAGSATFLVQTARTNNGTVNGTFSVTGLPAGATASFVPATFTSNGGNPFPNSTLTVSTTVSAPAGTYNITVQCADGSDVSTGGAGTLTIGPKHITGSFTANNKVYDGTNSATVATRNLSGVVGADAVTLTGGTATFNNKTVANGKTVTLTGATLTGAAASNYVLDSVSTTTANITALHITGSFTASNKAYDGTTAATVLTRTLNGTISGDVVSLTGGTATFSDKNVGNGKTVTLTGASLTGGDASNYVLDSVSTATANITKANATVMVTPYTVTYDGASHTATVTSITGVNGETGATVGTVDVSGTTHTLPAGSPYTDIWTFTGTANYNNTSGQITDIINAKHITGNFTAGNKAYDGTNSATVLTRSLSGVVGSDVVTLTGGTATFSDKNVGNGKTVTLTGATLSGADAPNYILDSVSTTTANITAKGLTINGAVANNKQYDGNTTATVDFTSASLMGVVSGDTVSINSSGYSASFASKSVGNAKAVTVTGVTLSGGDAGNYTVSQPTGLTADITARNLTISGAVAQNKVYDGNTDATVDFTGASLAVVVSGDTVTINHSGYSASFATKSVGNAKPVTVTGVTLSGADAGNYTVSQPSGLAADITAKNLTISGAVANNKQYDGGTTATVDFTGATLAVVVSGDSVTINSSGDSASFATKTVGNGKPVTVTGVTLSGADAGNYTVSQPSGLAADITAKNLTISGAVANNKQYDGGTTATVDFTGATLAVVVSGDSVSINSSGYSASFATKTVGNGKPVTVSGVTLLGGDAGNYTVSQPSGLSADITAKNLTISGAVANNKQYDGNTTATVDFTGASLAVVVSGDSVSINSSGYSASFATKTVGTGKAVTVIGVTLSGTDAGNYTVSQPSGLSADITAKNLTISGAVANNKQYDGNTTATVDFTSATLAVVISGDSVSINSSGYSASFATKTVGNGKPVTVSGVTLSGADAGNYMVSQPSGLAADITAKNLTISGVVANNKQYDGNTTATVDVTGATLAVVVSGDSVSINSSGYSASFTTKTVGTGKAVTVIGVALSGADAGNYTVSQPSGLSADITAKNLTISGAVAQNKQYDGNTTAMVDFTSATLAVMVSGDSVSINSSGYSASFATKSVGNGKTVTVLGVTLSGADAGNYTVSQPSGLSADITAKNLTISGASANNKQYDGNTTATVDFTGATLAVVVSSDSVSINSSGYSANFATKTVGNGKPVTVSGVTLSGGDAGNYTVSQPTGLTADITARNLTISGAVADSKQYDGNTTATVDFSGATLAVVVSGDSVSINSSGYSASFATKVVGTGKAVTVSGVTLLGADAGNYTVSQPSGLSADITAKNLTISGVVANNKQYDGNTTATVDFTGATLAVVVSGDSVSINSSGYSASFATKTVGTGKPVTVSGVTLSGGDAGNYTVSQPSGLSADITAKNLTISGAVANNKQYDGNTTAMVDFTSATLAVVVSGDSVSINSSGYSASFATKTVGNAKPVTVTGVTLSGGDAGNYTVSQPTGLTADITARNLTISGAVAQNKVYDGNTDATVDFTGASLAVVVSGDAVSINSSGYSASFATKTVGNGKAVTVIGVLLAGADAGNYTVSQPTGLTADITARNLTISGALAQNKVYDGNTDATVDFTGASLAVVVSGDAVSINSSGYGASFATKTVGNGKAVTVIGVLLAGADAGNYTVSQPTGLSADITAKNLTINGAVAQNKVYDGNTDATVDFTAATLFGVVSGDTVSINHTGYSASFATKTVGNGKAVTVIGVMLAGTDAGNYTISQPSGLTADITVLHITGSFTAANKAYDGNNSATVLTRSLVGAISGDAVTLTAGTATFSDKNIGNSKTVTLTGATLSGGDAGNYVLDSVFTTTANITALHISGSFTANNKVYDGNASATVLTRSLSGTVMGDVVSLTGGSASFADKTVGVAKVVMLTGATLTGTDSGNYVLDFVATTVANITALHVTGSFTASNKVYDGNTSATVLTRSVNSPAIGDMVSLTAGTATFADKNVGTGKMVTLVGASLSGLDAGNYVLDSVGMAMANISAATVTVSIVDNSTKTYDGNTNATLTVASFSLSGVVTGESITVTKTTGTYNTKDVATANTVTTSLAPGNFAAGGGTLLSNYMLPTSASGPGHISKANATVNVTGYSVVYDGQAHTATYTITGVNGETGSTVGTINVTGTTHTPPGVYPNDPWTFTGAANYTNSSGIVYDLIAFNGVIGLNSVSISSQDALIDSFDSAVGPYSNSNKSRLAKLLSNGVINLGGGKAYGDLRSTQSSVTIQTSGLVTGNVTAGTTISNSGTINGTATQHSPTTALVAPPVAACTPFSSSAGISGNFSYNAGTGDLTVSGGNTVTVANGTYCFHSVTLSGGSTLRVNGPVAIRLTGLLTASGGSFMNMTYVPANLRISTAYTGNNGVTVSGGSGAYLSVYAPGTDITLSGGSPLYGALLGKTLTASGGSSIHYDIQLAPIFGF